MTDLAWIDTALTSARPQAIGALLRYFRDLDIAEEAFQDACLRALKSWPQNGPPRDPAAWLIMVGRNAAIDGVRRRSRQEALPEEDQISDLPMRQLAAEITREKLYLRLHQELPYSSHVETEKWEEKKDRSVRIEQVIYVERDSQKKILLGHKGETIKAIGQAARKEIGEILEQKVHLFLFVKVRENWGDDPERYREMGLEFPG